ncbi:MAG: hypothetical protein ACLQUY_23420 [Ktedonobacterales bacterium]
MQATSMVCPRCGQRAPTGTRYCTTCGDPLDPALVTEVRELYYTIRNLDGSIAAGHGNQTVAEIREEFLARYLALRTAPASEPNAAPSTVATTASGSSPSTPTLAATPAASPSQPTGPAFSWQAFLADQAISIMSYLGGFLLLVATATFEVGGWQVLPSVAKLAVVCAVYVVFGGLGFALRRLPRLATVGRTYLAVFALMTPLVALAIYRFQLQASGFSAGGMLCITALYATVIYLTLGLHTRFITYGYLGWVSLIVAALAVIPWSGAPAEWWAFVLASAALVLLTPRLVHRFGIAEALGPAAAQLSAGAGVAAALGVEGLLLVLAQNAAGAVSPSISLLAVTAAACVLVPLAAGWSRTLRRWTAPAAAGLTAAVETLAAALAAQAGFCIAVWLGATQQQLAYVLAGLALAELAAAQMLRWLRPKRVAVRHSVEAFALALASCGTLLVTGEPAPNWPLAAALTAGALVGVGIALAENAPWWLLATGFLLTLDYQVIGTAILPPSHLAHDSSAAYAGLTLAFWVVALASSLRKETRRFAVPLFVVALGDALYTSLLLLYRTDTGYQTAVLLTFAVASFIAARRIQRPIFGSIPVAVFGVLAALPFALDDSNGWHLSLLALVMAIAALAVRRLQGRLWALAPYVAGLVAAILAIVHSGIPGVSTAGLEFLGLPWSAWLALIFGALAGIAAIWEEWPWTMTIPAVFALWVVLITGDSPANLGLVFVIAGAGVAARHWRGRWWGTALYTAALCGSAAVVIDLSDLGTAAPYRQVPLLLVYGLAAYLVAAHERQPWFASVVVAYLVAAVWLLPGPNNLVPTVALTFGLVACGVGLRFAQRSQAGLGWRLPLYAAAVGASVFALFRIVPYDAGWAETLLMVFAAVAYIIAVQEDEPLAATVPIGYAAAAALVQTDPQSLLPLALGLAVGGLAVGRIAGIRWSYPFYAASAVAATATTVLGQSHSTFEALALFSLAITAYAIAAVESRPDLLAVALTLGVLALAAGNDALELTQWQATLAFAALGWVYALGRMLWQAMPGLRSNGPFWWTSSLQDPELKIRWGDTRYAGVQLHSWAAILVGSGAVVSALIEPDMFTPHSAETQVVVAVLVSFAVMLALVGREWNSRLSLYGAGELVALAISWELRWLGASNIQAFILVPGSYQLLIGALLPAGQRLGQAATLIGALLLLVPTLVQSFQAEPNWVYALAMALEALIILGAGVGTRSRTLVLVASAFVVLAAIRGAILAAQSGLPIPVVIGVLAVLLMGGATWLSLGGRREAARRT